MGGPLLRGAFQVTSRLQPEPAVAVTLGAAGASGASAASVTLIVKAWKALPPLGSESFTLTL